MSHGINEGVIETHQKGILTSASLMVRWPAAHEAATFASRYPNLSVGLHLDFGEWTFDNESWRLAYGVVPLDDRQAVANELERQLQQFRELMGREPSHLDSHQHVHESEPLRSLCLQAARQRGIVLRNTETEILYCGDFYGQSNKGYPYPEGISASALVKVLKVLPEGVTELGCHPAKYADMEGMYRHERLTECATLCDPQVRSILEAEGIQLCSFKNWRDQGPDILTR